MISNNWAIFLSGLLLFSVMGFLAARDLHNSAGPSMPMSFSRFTDERLQVVCWTNYKGLSCLPCSSLKDGVCPSK